MYRIIRQSILGNIGPSVGRRPSAVRSLCAARGLAPSESAVLETPAETARTNVHTPASHQWKAQAKNVSVNTTPDGNGTQQERRKSPYSRPEAPKMTFTVVEDLDAKAEQSRDRVNTPAAVPPPVLNVTTDKISLKDQLAKDFHIARVAESPTRVFDALEIAM